MGRSSLQGTQWHYEYHKSQIAQSRGICAFYLPVFIEFSRFRSTYPSAKFE